MLYSHGKNNQFVISKAFRTGCHQNVVVEEYNGSVTNSHGKKANQ